MTSGDRRRGTRRPSDGELRLWRKAMRDATPLPGRGHDEPPAADEAETGEGRHVPPPEEPEPAPVPTLPARPRPADRAERLPELRHDFAPGVDKRTVERMRRGQLRVEGRIDLHGLTREGAHRALIGFLARARDEGRRCVIVITGRGARSEEGAGVLRTSVPRWLNEAPLRGAILAFCQAQPKDGGAGALYVLLKRKR